MNWTFDIRGVPEFIRVTSSGPFNLDEFPKLFDELSALEQFAPGCRVLLDGTELDLDQVTDRDLFQTSNELIRRNREFAYTKLAIVTTPEDLHVGHKFEKITEYGSRAIMQVFDDETHALHWLVGGVFAATSLLNS